MHPLPFQAQHLQERSGSNGSTADSAASSPNFSPLQLDVPSTDVLTGQIPLRPRSRSHHPYSPSQHLQRHLTDIHHHQPHHSLDDGTAPEDGSRPPHHQQQQGHARRPSTANNSITSLGALSGSNGALHDGIPHHVLTHPYAHSHGNKQHAPLISSISSITVSVRSEEERDAVIDFYKMLHFQIIRTPTNNDQTLVMCFMPAPPPHGAEGSTLGGASSALYPYGQHASSFTTLDLMTTAGGSADSLLLAAAAAANNFGDAPATLNVEIRFLPAKNNDDSIKTGNGVSLWSRDLMVHSVCS